MNVDGMKDVIRDETALTEIARANERKGVGGGGEKEIRIS